MLRLAFALAILAALATSFARAQAPVDRSKLEAFVDGAVREAMRTDKIAGVSLAIVDRTGVVMARGFGAAGFEPYRRVDGDTLFRVGSISKTPVWIAIMQLVEQGKLSLDDPINEKLPPALRIPDEGFKNPILVRHLMTHSAGFEDTIEGLFVREPEKLGSLDEEMAKLPHHRVREPGVLAVYSNYGAALAGALVAAVSGEAWPDYAERHIFGPLGMTGATYREPYPASVASAHGLPEPMSAEALAKSTNGFAWLSGAYRTEAFEFVTNDAPAGALSVSAKDMATYMQALLDPEIMAKAGVLKVETALALREPLFANTPDLAPFLHGFFNLQTQRGHAGFGHGGSLVFQKSTMEIYPDLGFAVFVSVNTPTGSTLIDKLPALLLDGFYAKPEPSPKRATNAEEEGRKVAGVYRALRLPTYRSEAPLVRYYNQFQVRTLPSGNILLAGRRRYKPLGEGVFASLEDGERIAFHEVDGRMRMYDGSGTFPSDRIDFLETGRWLRSIFYAAVACAVWAVVAAIERLFRRDRSGGAASIVLDGLAVLWLAAGALFLTGVTRLNADPHAFLFIYPGWLYPAGCWALLVAAVATPLAALVALGLRPRSWSRWMWARSLASLAVYAVLIATLADWRVLGFSS